MNPTLAEELKAQSHISKWEKAWRALQAIIAVVTIVMAFALLRVNEKTNDTANRANSIANIVDTTLDEVKVATCRSRTTTLRTAPITIRDFRALMDAQAPAARLVCPELDYERLERLRLKEVADLKAGVPAAEIAARPYIP